MTGAFDDDVRVVPLPKRLREAPVGADELHSLPVEVVRRLEGGRPPPQRVQQRERVLDRGKCEEPDRADRQQRREAQAGARDDSERALAADEQSGEVITCVVLQQPAQPPHGRPVGEHRLQAGHPGPRHAVPGRERAAGVRRDDAADRRRAASGEVDREVETLPANMILEALERDAGAALDLLRQHVDGCEVAESHEAEHDLAGSRHRATDHAGVSALDGDGRAVLAARTHHRGHLVAGGRANDEARLAAESSG